MIASPVPTLWNVVVGAAAAAAVPVAFVVIVADDDVLLHTAAAELSALANVGVARLDLRVWPRRTGLAAARLTVCRTLPRDCPSS